MKMTWMWLCTPLALALPAMLATAQPHVQKEKFCSYTAINGDCTLILHRTAPLVPPTIYVQHGHTVTVRVPDPLPFEHLTIDLKSASELVPQD
jgi:hypothetical protein